MKSVLDFCGVLIYASYSKLMEVCQSGRMGLAANELYLRVPQVRILSLPHNARYCVGTVAWLWTRRAQVRFLLGQLIP